MHTETDWLGDIQPEPKNVGGRPAKGYKARGNHKLECPTCGFHARCSAGALSRAGALPTCGCGAGMILPNIRDRATLEPEQVEAELQRMPRDAFARTCRELGWTDLLRAETHRERKSSAGPARCQWEHGHCMVFVAGRYCDEHDPAARAAERRSSRAELAGAA